MRETVGNMILRNAKMYNDLYTKNDNDYYTYLRNAIMYNLIFHAGKTAPVIDYFRFPDRELG